MGDFRKSVNGLQIGIGVLALCLGGIVYLVSRPPEKTYFVYASKLRISLYQKVPDVFGVLGNSLPDFLHVFSFIMITAGLVSKRKIECMVISLSWFLVEVAFEVFQKFKEFPLKIIPEWFINKPVLENVRPFFMKGTFDFIDLVAVALGTVAAYFVSTRTMKERVKEEK
ncbi:MAG: hypothetical protein JRJ29_14840 [Deltaproteobacteria bacterium]|nr:hypothetical protein [Deltaproteobacteria bacterium]